LFYRNHFYTENLRVQRYENWTKRPRLDVIPVVEKIIWRNQIEILTLSVAKKYNSIFFAIELELPMTKGRFL